MAKPEETLKTFAHLLRNALQTRVMVITEEGEAVEYEASLVRSRLANQGIKANISALRSGRYYRSTAQFDMLQRAMNTLQELLDGDPVTDDLTGIDLGDD
jgi:MarR-like DNA-binding transcriptional regulator SgrR of sgrS sRNA